VIVLGLLSLNAITFNEKGILDLGILYNYSEQDIPVNIFQEEVHFRNISDEITTLGRVLFYDKQLSLNNSISCATCHNQSLAFGDTLKASLGFDGRPTERHSTRLVNLNFSHMPEVFWDMRAGHLDSLPIMVLSNSIEMGFSGEEGQPPVDSLIRRIDDIEYYNDLFQLAFNSSDITQEKVNLALSQFVRSIVSYDSKYDIGRSMVEHPKDLFPNFSTEENRGKELFLSPFSGQPNEHFSIEMNRLIVEDKMGCAECHGIDNFTSRETSLTGHNGIIGVINHPNEIDTTVKRSPSLRNLFTKEGHEIGPFMHDGSLQTLAQVIDHYNRIGLLLKVEGLHTSLDIAQPNGIYDDPTSGAQGPQGTHLSLRIDDDEMNSIVAFLRTLTGDDIFHNPKWNDPFDENGQLILKEDCHQLLTRTVEKHICEGDSYEGFYTSGIHEKRFQNQTGCDSLIIINLIVNQSPEVHLEKTICEGDTFEGYTQQGYYLDAFSNSSGCDTFRFLDLVVTPTVYSSITSTICKGESYYGYTEPGTYTDTILNDYTGCRQITTIKLSYVRPKLTFSQKSICRGDSYKGFSTPGWHTDTIDCYNANRYLITLVDTFNTFISDTICEGESFRGFTTQGKHIIYDKANFGCDSLTHIDLTVLENSQSVEYVDICEGESYESFSTSGVHYENHINALGCDSIRYVILSVNQHTHSYEKIEFCAGESFEEYSTSGVFEEIHTNSFGCDSLRTIDITVLEHSQSLINVDICEGENFEGYTSTGVFVDNFVSANGCDSVRFLNLTVLQHSESYYDVDLCQGEEIEGYSQSGIYVDIFENYLGCDSTRQLNINVNQHTESHHDVAICDGDSFWGHENPGQHLDLLVNKLGCDSSRFLNLTVLEHSESFEEIHLCPGENFEGYTEGEHIESYENAVGCDSTRYLSLINIPIDDVICIQAYEDIPRDISLTNYLNIYPSPVTDLLNLKITKPERIPARLMIYNSKSQLIHNKEITKDLTQIDFSNHSSGLYLIYIKKGRNLFYEKILKI